MARFLTVVVLLDDEGQEAGPTGLNGEAGMYLDDLGAIMKEHEYQVVDCVVSSTNPV